MNVTDVSRVGKHHQRHGDCHRCGWTETLQKWSPQGAVGMSTGIALALGLGGRWLCDDCVSEFSSVPVERHVPVATTFRPAPFGARVAVASRRSRARSVA
jgi:hypothetical protein